MKKGAAGTSIPMDANDGTGGGVYKPELKQEKIRKPYFRPALDDTKPSLKDPILRSDPMETEEAVLRLPPFPIKKTESEA